MPQHPVPPPTQADDESWTHVCETVLMVDLAVARIENALRDGDDSIKTLADSFTDLAARVQCIESLASELEDTPRKDKMLAQCTQAGQRVQDAIIAFQFYDKLTQRLAQVTHSLDALTELVADPVRHTQPGEWQKLQQEILSRYTLDADRALFEAILRGESTQAVLASAAQHPENRADIELF